MASTTDTGRAAPLSREQRRRVIAKIAFVTGGTLSFLLSVGLWFLGDEPLTAIYVGLWVPSLFSLGALVSNPIEGS